MGSYKPDNDSTSGDSENDQHERDPNQPSLGVFEDSEGDTSDSDDSGGAPLKQVPGGGSGGSGESVHKDTGTPREEPEPGDGHESEVTDEDEDDEEDTVVVTHTVDPLSAMSWGIQPVVNRVTEIYGDQVEFKYQVAPVRTFDNPEAMRTQWESSNELHNMPVDSSFWDNPPESTELLNRAWVAAMRQGATELYLRALWIECIAGGKNLSDEDALNSLASRLGLDVDGFQDDMEDANLDSSQAPDRLPVTTVPIKGRSQTWTGYVHYNDFKEQFIFEGLDEGQTQDLVGFVDEYRPVATPEVMEVYQWDREQAMENLQKVDGVYSKNIGEGLFWLAE